MTSPLTMVLRFVALFLVVGLSPLSGSGQLLYTNGVPDNLDGFPIPFPYAVANDFNLATATQLGSFDFYVVRNGTQGPASITGNFSWSVFNDAGATTVMLALCAVTRRVRRIRHA